MQAKAEAAESEHPIPHSQPRARMFSLEHAQLLAKGKDLEAEVLAGTEGSADAGEESKAKWNHEFRLIT
jgi:hypothetical protein